MAVEKLMIQMGLTDQVSKPLGKMQRQLDSLAQKTKKSFTNIGVGAAGIFAGGAAIKTAMMPAIEMDRKLGEVKSLGVVQKDLDKLSKTALEFSVKYGKSATEFVDSSYKIKSAISSLTGNELSEMTRISGVLAAATKADSQTITGYMGQMHKIFNADATKMGNTAWAEKIAGQTATVVKMFNTEGSEMAKAFQNFQSIGAKNNIAMEEQFAVLGTLQAITQSGARAGTQYSAFMQGVAKAQGKLGNLVSFQNKDGSMKSVVDILGQLKGLYGDTLDLSEQAGLKELFGGQKAVDFIMNMMNETDGLSKSINDLQNVTGIGEAEEMASAMTDQYERLDAAMNAVKVVLGTAILPSLNKVASAMANGSKKLMKYMEQYPTLTKYAGFAITAILGIGIALGIATIAAGVFGGAMAILTSPITLVIAGVAALGAGIVYFWDYIKPILVGFYDGFVKASGIDVLFEPLLDMFNMLGEAVGWVVEQISSWLPQMDAGSDSISKMAGLGDMLGRAFAVPFKFIIDKLQFIMGKIRSVIDFAKSLPFMGDDDEVTKVTKQINKTASNDSVYQPYNATAPTPAYSYLQGQKQTNVPVGGIRSQLTNNNNGRTVNMGGVTVIQPQQNMSITELAENQEMAHG